MPYSTLYYTSFYVSSYPLDEGFLPSAPLTVVGLPCACVAASLASTHYMPVAPFGYVSHKYLQMLADVPRESGGLILAEYQWLYIMSFLSAFYIFIYVFMHLSFFLHIVNSGEMLTGQG